MRSEHAGAGGAPGGPLRTAPSGNLPSCFLFLFLFFNRGTGQGKPDEGFIVSGRSFSLNWAAASTNKTLTEINLHQ